MAPVRFEDRETDLAGITGIGHTDAVRRLVFSDDGKRLVSGGADDTVRIWDTETAKQLGEWPVSKSIPYLDEEIQGGFCFGAVGPPSFDLTSGGHRLVIASRGVKDPSEQLQVIDTSSGKVIASRSLPPIKVNPGRQSGIGLVGFSRDEQSVFVTYGEADGSVQGFNPYLARWNLADNSWHNLGPTVQSPTGRRVPGRGPGNGCLLRAKHSTAAPGRSYSSLPERWTVHSSVPTTADWSRGLAALPIVRFRTGRVTPRTFEFGTAEPERC